MHKVRLIISGYQSNPGFRGKLRQTIRYLGLWQRFQMAH
jgi:hypothetical protein